MEVKAGYRQSEIGIVPADWDVKSLGKFIALQRGHDLTERDRRVGDIPVMGSAGVNGSHDTAIAKGPGVVLGRSGASFGQAHYCEVDFWPHNTALYVTDFFGNYPLFVYYFLKGIDFSRHNSGGAQQSLNRNFIAPILIAVPTRNEQEAIAEALSDADALIEALEQLIAKKRQVKQGAMQELLTGKRRLPAFSGEWKYRPLVEFVRPEKFAIVDGPFGTQMKVHEYVSEGIPVIEMEHLEDAIISKRLERCITPEKFEQLKRSAVYPGDLVISKTGSLGRLGVIPDNFEKGLITSRLAKITLDTKRANRFFIFQYLLKLRGDGYWEKVSQGGTMQILGIRMLQEVPIPNISDEEQTAIAEILSDMDAEIAALEGKLSTVREVKAGMMSVLLSGKVRLV